MTAKSILVRRGRVFSAAEIEGIMAVARDPFCPDVMDLGTVEAAAKYGRENAEPSEITVPRPEEPYITKGFADIIRQAFVPAGSPETEENDLMAAVREIARGR